MSKMSFIETLEERGLLVKPYETIWDMKRRQQRLRKYIQERKAKMANDEVTKAEAEDTATTSENLAQKFSRIASKRLQNVLDDLRILRNCSGPSYEYTPEQVDKMDKYIQDEFDKLKAAFRGEKVVEKSVNLL